MLNGKLGARSRRDKERERERTSCLHLIYTFSRPKRKVLAIYLGFIIASLRNILAIIRAALVAIISSKHYMMRMILPHSGSLVIKTVSYVIILDFRVAMSSRYYYSDDMYGN